MKLVYVVYSSYRNVFLNPLRLFMFTLLYLNRYVDLYLAMLIENINELAFDNVTPEDPDFSSIQGDDSKRVFVLYDHFYFVPAVVFVFDGVFLK